MSPSPMPAPALTRRQLTTVLALWAAGSPARAQTPLQRPVRIYYLSPAAPQTNPQRRAWIEALDAGLQERGLQPQRDYQLLVLSAQGRNEAYPALVRQALEEGAQVLVTPGNSATRAGVEGVAAAGRKVAVVCVNAGDVQAQGLVSNLARPGGQLTGRTAVTQQLDPKRLELLRELVPGLKKLAVLAMAQPDGTLSANYRRSIQAMQAAAPELAVQAHPLVSGADRAQWLESVRLARPDALLVFDGVVLLAAMNEIVTFSTKARLPLMAQQRNWVDVGGLASYGPNNNVEHRLLAGHVARIMEGTPPGELPLEQPTQFELVIHGGTARALKLPIPPALAVRAEVLG